jgi:hypothetical protein
MVDYETSRAQVSSKEDLANFIEALREDLLRNPAQWENGTLDLFGRDGGLGPRNGRFLSQHRKAAETPTWSVFADILSAAKIYE